MAATLERILLCLDVFGAGSNVGLCHEGICFVFSELYFLEYPAVFRALRSYSRTTEWYHSGNQQQLL
jgi:hypothetical protein